MSNEQLDSSVKVMSEWDDDGMKKEERRAKVGGRCVIADGKFQLLGISEG